MVQAKFTIKLIEDSPLRTNKTASESQWCGITKVFGFASTISKR
jgi:hypothetical protein